MSVKNNPIKELAAMLNEGTRKPKKKNLLEGYISEEDFDPSMGQMPMPRGGEDDFAMEEGGEGDAMAEEQGILPIKNEIDQIRQIALKTVAKLAENPTSECYRFMKKVFLDCDRALEAALQPEDNKKKKSF